MKTQKAILTLMVFATFSLNTIGQVTVGTTNKNPLKGVLLQLTNKKPDENNTNCDKAIIYPRVFLNDNNLSDLVIDDNTPNNAKLYQGAVVFNSNPKLIADLYLWDGIEWKNFITVQKEQQDKTLVAFKQTSDADELLLQKGNWLLINPLSISYTAPRNGILYINTILYCKMSIDNDQMYNMLADVSNTFFKISAIDNTNKDEKVTTDFYTATRAITALASEFKGFPGKNTNSTHSTYAKNNPASAYGLFSLPVKAGHSYEIDVYGQEGWNDATFNPESDDQKGKAVITSGTYKWKNSAGKEYKVYSTIKVDFISEAYTF